MTHLYVEAVTKIPKEYICEGTCMVEHQNRVVMANPKLKPMIFEDGEWNELELYEVESK